ncbi:MAG: hypothetical protein J7515_19965 [Caulobacter sp.]|nr:hypothetical protein [Caulobacter sp.]
MLLAACALAAFTPAGAQDRVGAPPTTIVGSQVDTRIGGSPPLTDTEALAMLDRGDNWTGVNAFRRVVAKQGGVMNRFNLATGYQRTGRLDQAKAIYRDLLVDGEFTTAVSSVSGGPSTFNVADEAASRLLYIQWLQNGGGRQLVRLSGSGAVSADSLGVPVAAIEGGGEVSDAEAAARDLAARRAAAP